MHLESDIQPVSRWSDDLALASMALARRFASGRTLWCHSPCWPQHAEHIAVEFVHPVIVGTRALPAEVISGPEPVDTLRAVLETGDVLVVVAEAREAEVAEMCRRARERGAETIWIGGGRHPPADSADHFVWVGAEPSTGPAFDGEVVLSYHVLWELTHVCLEHLAEVCDTVDGVDAERHCTTCSDEGRIGEVVAAHGSTVDVRTPVGVEEVDATLVDVRLGDLVVVHAGVAICRLEGTDVVMSDHREQTGFLYPFLDHEERDSASLLGELAASAAAKASQSSRLRDTTVERCGAELDAIAHAMTERFANGGRLFVFGNGGSATDADGIAQLFRSPSSGLPLGARSLVANRAVVTALANDVGFDLVFSRQLIAHGRPGDIAMGVSTSGSSTNLLAAIREAKRSGILAVGLAGYDGGQMAVSADIDYCLVVASDSVHRIQEAQGALGYALWARVQEQLAARDRSAATEAPK